MQSFADRARRWYVYERDCNAKTLAMLESVPEERRGTAEFQKSVDRMAHMVAARRRWLVRLGRLNETLTPFPQGTKLGELSKQVDDTEARWAAYLADIDDAELNRVVQWEWPEGDQHEWPVDEVLTQLFGHAWYHRGQIAQLVAALGGKAVDTDYIYWAGAATPPPRA